MASYEGYARRIDVHFRARFPHVQTRLFETEPNCFVIVFPREVEDATSLADEFDRTIRFMTANVRLSNDVPATPSRELTPMTDAEAAGDLTGIPVNISDFNSLIISRFPKLPVVGLREGADQVAHIVVAAALDDGDAEQVIAFVDSLGLPMKAEIELTPDLPSPKTPRATPGRIDMSIGPAKRRPQAPAFVAADEAFWFENLQRAGAGQMTVERFPGFAPDVFRCFLDFSVSRHVNLRQALLLYDEVCCSLPLAENHPAFLADQGLTDDDLLALVEHGRLRVISTQPEERLRLPLLNAMHERNASALVGRRATALLILSDIAQMADRYRLAELTADLRGLADAIAPPLNLQPAECLRLLSWPMAARREGLHGLLGEGSKGHPARTLANDIGVVFSRNLNHDVALETLVGSERVLLGHALGATVFPALDEPTIMQPLMNALGRHLNFYKGFNTAVYANWARNEQRRVDGVEIMPAIPLLEFDPKVPINEVLLDGGLGSTRAKGRSLMARLSDMPQQMREEEVRILIDRLRKQSRHRAGNWLTLDNLDTAVSTFSLFGGFPFPPVAGLYNIGAKAVEAARRIPAVDRFMQSLQEDAAKSLSSNQELDFLSRIDRVAWLRRDRI